MRDKGHGKAIEYVRGMYEEHSIPTCVREMRNGTHGKAESDDAFIDCDGMVTVTMKDADKNGQVTENRYMFPAGWFAGNDDGNSRPWHESIIQHSGIIIDEHRSPLTEGTLPTLPAQAACARC